MRQFIGPLQFIDLGYRFTKRDADDFERAYFYSPPQYPIEGTFATFIKNARPLASPAKFNQYNHTLIVYPYANGIIRIGQGQAMLVRFLQVGDDAHVIRYHIAKNTTPGVDWQLFEEPIESNQLLAMLLKRERVEIVPSQPYDPARSGNSDKVAGVIPSNELVEILPEEIDELKAIKLPPRQGKSIAQDYLLEEKVQNRVLQGVATSTLLTTAGKSKCRFDIPALGSGGGISQRHLIKYCKQVQDAMADGIQCTVHIWGITSHQRVRETLTGEEFIKRYKSTVNFAWPKPFDPAKSGNSDVVSAEGYFPVENKTVPAVIANATLTCEQRDQHRSITGRFFDADPFVICNKKYHLEFELHPGVDASEFYAELQKLIKKYSDHSGLGSTLVD